MSDYFRTTPSPIREESVEAWAIEFSPTHPLAARAREQLSEVELLANKSAIRSWLLGYAWLDESPQAKVDRVNCIMSQDGWQYIDALADKYAGAQWEPGPAAFAEGVDFAMSALYECHAGPHTAECPSWDNHPPKLVDSEDDGWPRSVTF